MAACPGNGPLAYPSSQEDPGVWRAGRVCAELPVPAKDPSPTYPYRGSWRREGRPLVRKAAYPSHRSLAYPSSQRTLAGPWRREGRPLVRKAACPSNGPLAYPSSQEEPGVWRAGRVCAELPVPAKDPSPTYPYRGSWRREGRPLVRKAAYPSHRSLAYPSSQRTLASGGQAASAQGSMSEQWTPRLPILTEDPGVGRAGRARARQHVRAMDPSPTHPHTGAIFGRDRLRCSESMSKPRTPRRPILIQRVASHWEDKRALDGCWAHPQRGGSFRGAGCSPSGVGPTLTKWPRVAGAGRAWQGGCPGTASSRSPDMPPSAPARRLLPPVNARPRRRKESPARTQPRRGSHGVFYFFNAAPDRSQCRVVREVNKSRTYAGAMSSASLWKRGVFVFLDAWCEGVFVLGRTRGPLSPGRPPAAEITRTARIPHEHNSTETSTTILSVRGSERGC
ncbi:hypothetical protein NDU88_000629 [Pleurodeles waltl]|uniref:Uncharacterized protein n=1 Tax=Pleurodeles waltl TaxID=8319 RepID=A0AAV7MLE4_PLEWA|nr:hypothetical protein NDU88_000629 [Pleurodeles waltl]